MAQHQRLGGQGLLGGDGDRHHHLQGVVGAVEDAHFALTHGLAGEGELDLIGVILPGHLDQALVGQLDLGGLTGLLVLGELDGEGGLFALFDDDLVLAQLGHGYRLLGGDGDRHHRLQGVIRAILHPELGRAGGHAGDGIGDVLFSILPLRLGHGLIRRLHHGGFFRRGVGKGQGEGRGFPLLDLDGLLAHVQRLGHHGNRYDALQGIVRAVQDAEPALALGHPGDGIGDVVLIIFAGNLGYFAAGHVDGGVLPAVFVLIELNFQRSALAHLHRNLILIGDHVGEHLGLGRLGQRGQAGGAEQQGQGQQPGRRAVQLVHGYSLHPSLYLGYTRLQISRA